MKTTEFRGRRVWNDALVVGELETYGDGKLCYINGKLVVAASVEAVKNTDTHKNVKENES